MKGHAHWLEVSTKAGKSVYWFITVCKFHYVSQGVLVCYSPWGCKWTRLSHWTTSFMCLTLYFDFRIQYSMLITKSLVPRNLTPFTHFVLPQLLSPLVNITLFFVSAVCCFYLLIYLLICVPYMSEISWYFFFSVWLISLSIIPSRPIPIDNSYSIEHRLISYCGFALHFPDN